METFVEPHARARASAHPEFYGVCGGRFSPDATKEYSRRPELLTAQKLLPFYHHGARPLCPHSHAVQQQTSFFSQYKCFRWDRVS